MINMHASSYQIIVANFAQKKVKCELVEIAGDIGHDIGHRCNGVDASSRWGWDK